jgi:hypothetical protein
MSFIERLKPAAKEGKFWLLFNVLGIAAYISIEIWLFAPRIPEEAFNGIDQLCFWSTMQFPLLALYLGINLTWIVMSRQSLFFKSRQLFIWILGCVAWGILLLFDPIAIKIVYLLIMHYGGFWNHDSGS